MPNKIDMTGIKLNALTFLNPTDKRENGKVVWECQCDCGNIVYVKSNNKTKISCGCIKLNNNPNTPEDFWKLVDRRSDDECWGWLDGMHKLKPCVRVQGFDTREAVKIAFLLSDGKTEGINRNLIYHTCNNKCCMNPKHLYCYQAVDPYSDKRTCKRCNVEKTVKDFKLVNKGLSVYCLDCLVERKEETKQYNKNWDKINYERKVWLSAKNRARKKKIPFNIEVSDIIIPDICPVLGIELYKSNKIKSSNSPSLDRIIPSLGYVKGNIRVISSRANTLKNNATVQEMELILNDLKRIQIEKAPDLSSGALTI